MLADGFGRIVREGDAIVLANVVEGFATEDFGLEGAAHRGEDFAAGLEVTVERTVRDTGHGGQF